MKKDISIRERLKQLHEDESGLGKKLSHIDWQIKQLKKEKAKVAKQI